MKEVVNKTLGCFADGSNESLYLVFFWVQDWARKKADQPVLLPGSVSSPNPA